MYDRTMAQGRIEDMIRVAERERLALKTRALRTAARGSGLRRIAATITHAILWPVRH
jgi:hypothetical protein